MSQAAVKVRAGQVRYTNLQMAPDAAKNRKNRWKIRLFGVYLVFSRKFWRVLELTKLELKSSKGWEMQISKSLRSWSVMSVTLPDENITLLDENTTLPDVAPYKKNFSPYNILCCELGALPPPSHMGSETKISGAPWQYQCFSDDLRSGQNFLFQTAQPREEREVGVQESRHVFGQKFTKSGYILHKCW